MKSRGGAGEQITRSSPGAYLSENHNVKGGDIRSEDSKVDALFIIDYLMAEAENPSQLGG